MEKILYIDTETTGLDKNKNDIIQVAGIIEIDGEEKERFNILCQPFSYENIAPEALEVQGRTIEQIREFQDPRAAYKEFKAIIGKYIDKYDKTDKFYVAGQNVKFDLEFLHAWAKKNNDNYLGSYMWWYTIDLLVFAAALRAWGYIKTQALKLVDICQALGIEIENAHDAMADIEVTQKCMQKIKEKHIKIGTSDWE